MTGRTNWVLCDALSHYLSDPSGEVASCFPWARSLAAYAGVARSLWSSFQPWEVAMATDILPTGPVFSRSGDPLSAPLHSPARTDLHVPLPDLRDASVNARGVHHLSRRVSHMLAWCEFSTYVCKPLSRTASNFSRSLAKAASLSYLPTQAWLTLAILRCSALPFGELLACLPRALYPAPSRPAPPATSRLPTGCSLSSNPALPHRGCTSSPTRGTSSGLSDDFTRLWS